MTLRVAPVAADQVIDFLTGRDDASHQQWPSWATVKSEWTNALLGWFDDQTLVGTGLVLRRALRPTSWWFDYLPEGPIIDWSRYDAGDIVSPLVAHLRDHGSATVKIGARLPLRRWRGETLLHAIPHGARRWRDLTPDTEHADVMAIAARLRSLGARPYEAPRPGFGGTMQPRYGVEVPLLGRSESDLRNECSASFRRNVAKSERAGVQVRIGDEGDIGSLHMMLVESGERDNFVPRGRDFFQRMYRAMNNEDPQRVRVYLAENEGVAHAAALRVGVGTGSCYTYGGSSTAGRAARPSNALQWRMLLDALDEGCATHDLRGVSDTLIQDDPLLGLTRFKLAMGGEAVEYLGEWDVPIRPLVARVVTRHLSRRAEA